MEMLTVVFLCVILLIIQLLLCYKVKRLVIKLIPAILLLIAVVVFGILMQTVSGLAALGYVVFGIISAILLIPCAVGWLMWAISRFIKKDNSKQTKPGGI